MIELLTAALLLKCWNCGGQVKAAPVGNPEEAWAQCPECRSVHTFDGDWLEEHGEMVRNARRKFTYRGQLGQ